jgi:Bacteriophage tail sheath protein
MPEYLSPGVYIEEVDTGPVAIAGVSTSTGAMIGLAQRGPLDRPTLCTSYSDVQSTFGSALAHDAAPDLPAGFNSLAYAAAGFFSNGGQRLYVTRVAPGTGTAPWKISVDLQDTAAKLVIAAVDAGPWANRTFAVVNGRYQQTGGLRLTFAPERPLPVTITGGSTTVLDVASTTGMYAGAVVLYSKADGTSPELRNVTNISGTTVTLDSALTAAPVAGDILTLQEFSLTIDLLSAGRIAQSETFHNLNVRPGTSNFISGVIGAIPATPGTTTPGASALIRADVTPAPAATDAARGPATPPVTSGESAGTDGLAALSLTAMRGLISDPALDSDDPDARRGMYAFRNIRGMLMISMPGFTDTQAQSDLLAMCEHERYKFAILDPAKPIPTGTPVPLPAQYSDWHEIDATPAEVMTQRGSFDSEYGALYYPWVVMDDPTPANPLVPATVNLPPSGHVMGIYARSDINRGVFKAPANEVIDGIVGLSHRIDNGTQDVLNPLGINCLRNFIPDNRGLRVWGARTVSSNGEWKYVNIRRLFQYIEASIDYGTQWVVFEPNNELLWARVRQSVSDFLTDTWRTGALMGTKPSEAFYVLCDRTTMTESDLENGRLIVEVGIAPTYPAEFVIFRISQWTGTTGV